MDTGELQLLYDHTPDNLMRHKGGTVVVRKVVSVEVYDGVIYGESLDDPQRYFILDEERGGADASVERLSSEHGLRERLKARLGVDVPPLRRTKGK